MQQKNGKKLLGEKPTTLITSVDETSDADELFSCEQTLDESYMVEMDSLLDSDEEINSLSGCQLSIVSLSNLYLLNKNSAYVGVVNFGN